MRVLITGIHGFLGAVVAQRLASSGHVIFGLGRREVSSRSYDFPFVCVHLGAGKARSVALPEVDAVVHCATPAHSRPTGDANEWGSLVWRDTVHGTEELFSQLSAKCSKRIFISSVKAKYTGINGSVYGAAKSAAEKITLESHGGIVLRLPIVVGVGMKGEIRRLIQLGRRGLLPEFPHRSDYRPLIDVVDVSRAVECLVEAPEESSIGRVWEVSDGHRYSLKELSEIIRSQVRAQVDFGRWLSLPLQLSLSLYEKTALKSLWPRGFGYFEEQTELDWVPFSNSFNWAANHTFRSSLERYLNFDPSS